MGFDLKLSALFLSIIFFSVFVSAYETYYVKEVNSDSFFIEQEEVNGFNQASIIYALNPEQIGEQGIIIQLKRTTGDFSDLYEYIRNSQINTIVVYSYDDFDYLEFGKDLRQSTGINVIANSGRSARDRYQIEVEALEEVSTTIEQEELNETNEPTNIQIPPGNNQIITGESISENKYNSNIILAGLIIGISIIIGFVILAFVLKKRQ
ncbi:MAG: hypothetical protein KBA47_00575 [Caldisericia bacterium]|jgi:hypothetical protein|nr:hypothetical protein [Caldisericia bacterium]